MEETPRTPPSDGARHARSRVSTGSPTRPTLGAASAASWQPGGAASAPTTPTGRNKASFRMRLPTNRFSSDARSTRRVAPPRRMSTRLQFTLRERLHSRRLSAQQAPDEAACENSDDDEDAKDDEEDEESDSDSESDGSSDEHTSDTAPVVESSSPQAATAVDASGPTRSKAGMSMRRRRERKRRRRRRRWIRTALSALVAFYYLFSLPLRMGLYFDPFFTAPYAKQWTHALTVFLSLDVVADICNLALRLWTRRRETRREQRRLAAQLELDVEGAQNVEDDDSTPDKSHRLQWSDALDVVACFPIEIVLLATMQYNALHIARLTKVFALRSLPSAVRDFTLTRRGGRSLFASGIFHRVLTRFLTVLMAIGIVWVHWSALLFILIAHVECGLDLTRTSDCASWAIDDQLRDVAAGGGGGSKWRVYSRAVYWASRTIITLGFSDVIPNSSRPMETFFAVIGEFAGAFWCAGVIAGFAYWFTLQHRQGSKNSHDMFVHRVEHLLGRAHFGHTSTQDETALGGSVVPNFLRRRIVEYLHHEWNASRVFGEPQFRAIVRQEQLRQGLTCELKTTKLLRLQCFSRQSLGFLNAMAGEMKLMSLAPLDWVIEYPGTQSLFFVVMTGTIAVVSPSDEGGQKIHTCGAGDCFGAITLFDASTLKEKAFAEEYAEILMLDTDGLERVLSTYYHDRVSTANGQRDEMHKAAQEDYTVFSERCKRRQELRAVMEPQDDPTATHTVPHWDALQTEMECAPRKWYNPQSLFRANWEAVRCLALLYLTFEVPYNVIFYYGGTSWSSFGPGGDWKFASTFTISAVVEFFFYIDLYLRCRAFQPRKNTNSRTFYLDAVANLPLALVVDIYDGCTRGPLPHGWKWLSLLRLVRLLRVRRLKKRVEATLPRANGVAQFIIYSAISILVYCHLVACMWFLAGHYSLPSSTFTPPTTLPSKPECLRMAQEYGNCTWTVMDGMEAIYDSGDHRFVYLRSMYFSISTFTTVAYGDILPYNILETWIATLATYVGGVLCYVMFGAMGAALARLARRRRETRYENHLRARVMEMHGVSRHVRSEINRFQTFRAKILAEHELEQEILNYITPGLRGELNRCIHGAEARRFAFMQSAKPAFCDAVAAVMTRRFYFAGDMIFTAGEPANEAMVICRGRVQLVDGESQLKVAVLADGATLAERSFVAQTEPMLVDYVAETVTEVSVLARDALVALWNHYPSEMRRMLNGDDDASDHPQERKYVPMSSTSVIDATHALSRILIRHDSRGLLGGADFEKQIKWQRAINGNTFRSRWEVVVGAVVIYNTFSILARVVFVPSPSTDAMITLTAVDYIFDLVLLVDIYLKSFHFLAPGDLLSVSTRIFAPQQIRQYYYREGWMVYDMLASMPLYYIGSNYALMTYFRLPRVLRALQLVEIGERIHAGLLHRWTASTSSAGVAYSLLGLSKVMMVLALCCHIGGSIFYAVSSHESKDSGRAPWVLGDVVLLQHVGDAGIAYLRSFYWAISTVTVVNYGDIVATTVRETAWACVICLVGTFFMSKVVSDLVDLLQSLDQCATEHRERIEQFEYVAQRRELPDDLTERGQVFLNYEYEVTHGLPPPEELFSSLPSQLQAQVYNEMYGSILRRVPLFESLSDVQIQELAAAPWRTELFLPDDMIVYENSLADALFVMRHGRAEVLRFASGLSITQIESGQLFGEAMFFTADEGTSEKGGPRRMVSIRALSFCEVLRLDREAWLRFLAMRASNRAAGRRVLELAQGEQLKSRAVLQKLESNLLSDRDGGEDVSGERSSMSSDELRDGFEVAAPEAIKNLQFGQRDLRMASAPPTGLPQASASSSGMRRFGSTPALLLSQMVRRLSFSSNNNTRRPSDAYAALATPDTTRPEIAPADVAARRAKSNMNVLRHFESSPMTPEVQETEEQHASHEPPALATMPRFVDNSRFCYRWDAVKFFAILYYVAALPLRVSFYDDIQHAAQLNTGNGDRVMRTWIVCEYVFIDGFLWLDIFMRLFVFVPTVRGEPLTSPRERRRWYMRHGSFVIDFMGSFPLEVLALLPIHAFRDGTERRSIVAAAFRLTTLVRCFQLEPLWWRLERQLYWFQKDTLTILKIVFVGVLSSHWLACLWYFVGDATTGISPLSWLTAPNMLAPLPANAGNATALTVADVRAVSLLNKYLRSYHYAIGSISTTTYGDIVSRNVAETIVQLVVTFLCIVFYGYVTTGVRQILSRKFARTIALEQDEAKIQRFARHYALSRSLTTAIRSHLRERWRQESDVDQNAVAHLLHGPLRREIAAYLRSPLFETVEPRRLAFDGLPEVIVTAILAELREEAYVEGEVIYEQFAVGDVMYFVESGTVQLTTQQRDHARITSLQQQGEYFGESCVVDRAVCGSERRETAVAHTACRLVVLHVDAFERVLALYPTYAATIRAAWTSQTSFAV